jgi:hypothetical protein
MVVAAGQLREWATPSGAESSPELAVAARRLQAEHAEPALAVVVAAA